MRKIVIASHGDLSKGIKSSLQMILGPMADSIVTYSLYPGQTAETFAREAAGEIQGNPQKEYIIFTDVYGASVCTSMFPLTSYPNVVLFAGMNLNLIIECMVSYPEPRDREGMARLLESSREGLRQVGPDAGDMEEEDF